MSKDNTAINKPVDILQELFDARTHETEFDLEGLDRIIHRHNGAGPAPRPARKTPSPPRQKKKKTTHYLSFDISDTLDHAKDDIKTLVDGHGVNRITKSSIVNTALQIVLEEYERNKEHSALVRLLGQRGHVSSQGSKREE